ncbi:MAG: sensor histidine kinase [Crocinitomicaceae bacterium]
MTEAEILTANSTIIYGLFTCSQIFDRYGKFKGFLISVKDITAEKEKEKLILKTLLTTQSSEQRRVADDLHDSLGQELSMAQLMVSNFDLYEVEDREFYNLVEICRDIMDGAIKRLREICFDLMPNVLVRGGIILAVNTLVAKLEYLERVEVKFNYPDQFPRLSPDLEIVIYRIVQEFINNLIKHSEATELTIELIDAEEMIKVSLVENGQGFDINKLNNIGENRGISNISTKVKAFDGQYEFNSVIGEGTWLILKFPKKETL